MRRLLKRTARGLGRLTLTHSLPRRVANAAYNRLPSAAYPYLHARLAKMFRDGNGDVRRGDWRDQWTVEFGGRALAHPLTAGRLWLDWDLAVSTLGHEPALKATYRTLLASRHRPALFLDVGANYGTHSALFLVHGIRVITFEPNPECHGYFLELCALNDLTPRLEGVALGDKPGELDFAYRTDETWLGTTDPETIRNLEAAGNVQHRRVPVRTLDDYLNALADRGPGPVILKIDTEGRELDVLRGSARILAEVQPIILFESWNSVPGRRDDVHRLLSGAGYEICALPLRPVRPHVLTRSAFVTSPDNDFAALPRPSSPRTH